MYVEGTMSSMTCKILLQKMDGTPRVLFNIDACRTWSKPCSRFYTHKYFRLIHFLFQCMIIILKNVTGGNSKYALRQKKTFNTLFRSIIYSLLI